MLHLFIVHSDITYLVANSIIKHLKLPHDKILFLVNRRQKVDYYNRKTLPRIKLGSTLSIIKNRKNMFSYFDQISLLVEDNLYRAYLPQSSFWKYHLVIAHQNCTSFSYIEEGLASYICYDSINNRDKKTYKSFIHKVGLKIINKITFGNKLNIDRVNFECDHAKYNNAYGLFDDCFPLFKNRKIIPAILSDNLSTKRINHFLIVGSEVEAGLFDLKDYLNTCIVFFNIFSKYTEEELYIKWHPHQSPTLKRKLRHILKKYLRDKFVIFDKEITIEELSMQKSDITFYQTISSGGFYAALFGKKVISIAQLMEISKFTKERMDLLPKKYFECIHHPKNIIELEKAIVD